MIVLPIPEATIRLLGGESIIVDAPKAFKDTVQSIPAMRIDGHDVYCLVGIEPDERELIKRSWCFFLGFHSGFIPVFSFRVAEMFTDQDATGQELVPQIADTHELAVYASKKWDYIKGPTGNIFGYAMIAEGECSLETPEGWKPVYKGDLIVYNLRSRNFWVISELLAKSFGWTIKGRETNREVGQESGIQETLPGLLPEA